MGIEEEEDKFKQWLFGMDRKYDGREPEFYRGKTRKEKYCMWQKYNNNEPIGD